VHRTVYGRRRTLEISAALVASLAWAATAQAQSYQDFSATFTTRATSANSGYRLAIDYVNPGDPQGKPYSVSKVVQTLHAGTRIDTSVPPRCEASDAEVIARGAGACPAETKIGSGDLEVDLGAGAGPLPRIVENDVTYFNADGALILMTESTNTPTIVRTASRVRVGERTFTSMVPPIPAAPPPDPFLAIRRTHASLDAVTAGGRSFITTPPTCPGSGAWTNTAEFTYRNGTTQTATSTSPCTRPAGDGGADSERPRIRVRGVPQGCAPRSFRARVRVRDDSRLRRVRVSLDGRRVRTTKRRSFRVRVHAARLRPGRHRLAVVAADVAGNRAGKGVSFRRCRAGRPRFVG
jgi:hypothetical protein